MFPSGRTRTVPRMPPPLPHPIPYQGSKRLLAGAILGVVGARRFEVLYEPFAGSAAITLAAASRGLADRFVVGDSLAPLVTLWSEIIDRPATTAAAYRATLKGQTAEGGAAHFARVRAEFNRDGEPVKLLYLLARCVKNAPRFGRDGTFNQSADHRRAGMRPERMAAHIAGASALLGGRTTTLSGDVATCLATAGPGDLVYLDPPWQGTTEGADSRYHQGFARARLEALLADLNARAIPWVLSYDGRSGARTYGDALPGDLWGDHLELHAGRSAQSTLAGRAERTIESLYLAPGLEAARVSATDARRAIRRASPRSAAAAPG
jgi:DNA adenine methylase